jgi:putative transposase
VQTACEVSERRACSVLGQSRSSQRYTPRVAEDEPRLVTRILQLVGKSPRAGYRQITRLLKSEGWQVNVKRIYRLWKREGLKVPQKKQKRTRLGTAEGGLGRRRAERPGQIWSMDFIFDRTTNGRPLKILSLIDEFTRECLALEVSRTFTSDDLVALLIKRFETQGIPEFIRCDNGPEFISKRLREFLARLEVKPSYVEPGSPWQNGFVESFHSRFRDECLALEQFTICDEAKAVVGSWQEGYNERRPHSSLGGQTPKEFADTWAASVRATPPPHTQPVLS